MYFVVEMILIIYINHNMSTPANCPRPDALIATTTTLTPGMSTSPSVQAAVIK